MLSSVAIADFSPDEYLRFTLDEVKLSEIPSYDTYTNLRDDTTVGIIQTKGECPTINNQIEWQSNPINVNKHAIDVYL